MNESIKTDYSAMKCINLDFFFNSLFFFLHIYSPIFFFLHFIYFTTFFPFATQSPFY